MEMEIEEIKMEQENKQVEMYINYLSHVFSQQPQGKPSREFIRAKEEFERLLMPNTEPEKDRRKYEWDFDYDEIMEKHDIKYIE